METPHISLSGKYFRVISPSEITTEWVANGEQNPIIALQSGKPILRLVDDPKLHVVDIKVKYEGKIHENTLYLNKIGYLHDNIRAYFNHIEDLDDDYPDFNQIYKTKDLIPWLFHFFSLPDEQGYSNRQYRFECLFGPDQTDGAILMGDEV